MATRRTPIQQQQQQGAISADDDEHENLFGNAGLLRLMLSFLGAGQHLYCASCKLWRQHYLRMLQGRTDKWGNDINPCSTTYRAVFESSSRLELAVASDFDELLETYQVQSTAGRTASIAVLRKAEKAGLTLKFTRAQWGSCSANPVFVGALRSGSLEKVR